MENRFKKSKSFDNSNISDKKSYSAEEKVGVILKKSKSKIPYSYRINKNIESKSSLQNIRQNRKVFSKLNIICKEKLRVKSFVTITKFPNKSTHCQLNYFPKTQFKFKKQITFNMSSNEGSFDDSTNLEGDSRNEYSDVAEFGMDYSRLQEILESRGVPSNFIESLGGRVHMLLQGSMSKQTSKKVGQLIFKLKETDCEITILECLTELNSILLMGDEETVYNISLRELNSLLIKFLRMESNYEIMLESCKAIRRLLDCVPRFTVIAVDALPSIIEKLQKIECIDVAEQALVVLNAMPPKYAQNIIVNNGITSCLNFIDFFSVSAQIDAMKIVKNCCDKINSDQFSYISSVLRILCSRLSSDNKTILEISYSVYLNLLECFKVEKDCILEICSLDMIRRVSDNLKIIPNSSKKEILFMGFDLLANACSSCPTIAVKVLESTDILKIIYTLMLGTENYEHSENNQKIIIESSSNCLSIMKLISNLMPNLPNDGIFEINAIINGQYLTYSSVLYRSSSIKDKYVKSSEMEIDPRVIYINELCEKNHVDKINSLVAFILLCLDILDFPCINYSKKICSLIILKCLYHFNRTYLPSSIRFVNLVRHLSTLLGSKDLRDIVHGIQMTRLCLEKLTDNCFNVFLREGIISLLDQLRTKNNFFNFSPIIRDKSDLEYPSIGSTSISSSSTSTKISKAKSFLSSMKLKSPRKTTSKDDILDQKSPISSPSYYLTKSLNYSFNFSPNSKSTVVKWIANNAGSAYEMYINIEQERLNKNNQQPLSYVYLMKKYCNLLWSATTNQNLDKAYITLCKLFDCLNSKNEDRYTAFELINSEALTCLSQAINNLNISYKFKLLENLLQKSIVKNCQMTTVDLSFNTFDKNLNNSLFKDVVEKFNECANMEENLSIYRYSTLNISFNETENSKVQPKPKVPSRSTTTSISSFPCIKCKLVPHPECKSNLTNYSFCVDVDAFTDLSYIEYLFTKNMDSVMKKKRINKEASLIGVSITSSKYKWYSNQKTSSIIRSDTSHSTSSPFKFLSNKKNSNRFYKMSKNITNSSSVTSPNFLFDSQMKKEDSETISSLDEGQTLTTIPIKIDEKDHSDKNENDVVSISHDLHPFETESSLTTVEKSKSQLSRNQSLDFYYGKSLLKRNSSVLGNLASLYINQQVNGADSSTSSVFNELDYTVSVINEEFWQTIHTIWYFPKIENKNNSINEICTTAEKNTETIVDHYCSNGEKVSDSINVLDCFFGLVNQWIVYKHPQSIYEKCSLFFNRIFKNSNMTSKLEEQLQDSIAAFTKFLPEWIYKLPIQNPYLFSFNSRQHLFNVMTFDHRRMLKKLKVPNISSPRTSRTYAVTKRKLIVRRQQLLESSSSFFNDISENLLEVSFENEEGTGLGPTVEFYSLLSMQFRLKALKMWRTSSYLTSQQDALTDLFVPIMGSGLFPDVLSSTDFDFNAPQSVDISKNSQPTNLRQLFVYFGRFLARSIKDDKPTDLTLSYSFFKWLVDGGKSVCSMAYLLDVDPVLYNSLTNLLLISNQSETKNKQNKDCQSFMDSSDCSIESMQLNFVLPSCYNNIELVKNGSNIPVNSSNVHEYVEAVVNYVMYEGVKNKFEAIIEGIQSILSEGPTWLRLFLPHEMMNMFGMNDAFTPWQYKDLIESIKPNHGYSYDHPTFINFIRMLTEFNLMEQRQFLRFVTGSPRLPFGGFPGLEPPIVVVRSYEVNSKIPVTSRDVSKEDNNKDLPNHVLDGSSHYLTEEDYHSFVDTDACNWSTSKENVSIKLLPSVMTCAHYLKMPNYQTVEEMKQRFKIALEEGSESFHLS